MPAGAFSSAKIVPSIFQIQKLVILEGRSGFDSILEASGRLFGGLLGTWGTLESTAGHRGAYQECWGTLRRAMERQRGAGKGGEGGRVIIRFRVAPLPPGPTLDHPWGSSRKGKA